MKKHARSRRFASYGVLGLMGVLAITFVFLLPKADRNVASVGGGHATEWSERLGAGEVFSACGSSATCSSTHYNCGAGNVVGATAEYADNWQWWCLSPDGGSDILCQENKPTGTWTAPTCPTACGTEASSPAYTCVGGNGSCSTNTPATASCAATAACTAEVYGACDNSGGYNCADGTVGTHSGNATDGWTWYCDGTPNDAAHRSVSCFYKPPADSCPAPSPGWVGVITSGDFIIAYSVPSVFSPATCLSEKRTCTNGTLSGSYTYSACDVITPTCANGGMSAAECAVWTNYCTGTDATATPPHPWEIWAFDDSTPTNYKFIEAGTVANNCVPTCANGGKSGAECPTGTWTAPTCPTSTCTSSTPAYTCVGGNGYCSTNTPATLPCAADLKDASCPTGAWSAAPACPTACGLDASTQTGTCTGGNGFCSGSAPTRPCLATDACVSPSASLSASPSTINYSESSSLSYSSSLISGSCTIDNAVGSVTANTSGTKTVSPTSNTTYTLSCSGGVSDTATVVVAAGLISASPTTCTIPLGSSSCSSKLTWSSYNFSSLSITNTSFTSANGNAQTVTLTEPGTVTFSLKNGSFVHDSATVTARCASGSWNGSICASAPTYSCTNPPSLTTSNPFAAPDNDPPVNTAYTYSAVGDTATFCQYNCLSNYHWNGSSCVANTYSCTNPPSLTTSNPFAAPDNDPPVNTAYTYSAVGDTATFCQYNCLSNYHWNGSSCVANTYSCTGSIPSGSVAWNNIEPSVDTPYTYSGTNPGSTPCKYHDIPPGGGVCTGLPSGGIPWNSAVPASDTAYSYSATAPLPSVPCKYHNGTPPGSCTADLPYDEKRPASIASYCSGIGVSCSTGYVSSIACHSGTDALGQSNWTPYGNSCSLPHCTGCGCVAPPPAIGSSLTASPEIIHEGSSSVLTWGSSSATSCTSPGGFSTGGATSGHATVSPANTSTYQVTCTGSGAPSTSFATVTVLHPAIDSFSATPSRVRAFPPTNVTSISWSTTDVSSCSVTRNGIPTWSGTSSSGKSDSVTGQTLYTITCDDLPPQSVTVNVVPDFKEF